MQLTPITINPNDFPLELQSFFKRGTFFDSSSSENARVIYLEKDQGYFLKITALGELKKEVAMTRYFQTKGFAVAPISYLQDEKHDYLLTEKVAGEDCTAKKYLKEPKKLAEILGETLARLHAIDFSDCPFQHTTHYLKQVEQGRNLGNFTSSFGYETPEKAWAVVASFRHLLKSDTLLHGDYCLPNVLLKDWQFSKFIDLDHGGVGDKHVDLFWGAWSLEFNLKTAKYKDYFFDAYGRKNIQEELFPVIAALESFG